MSQQILSSDEAEQQGLRPLTSPYRLPGEKWMLENTVRDMRRGRIEYALVSAGAEAALVEVWRKDSSPRERDGMRNLRRMAA